MRTSHLVLGLILMTAVPLAFSQGGGGKGGQGALVPKSSAQKNLEDWKYVYGEGRESGHQIADETDSEEEDCICEVIEVKIQSPEERRQIKEKKETENNSELGYEVEFDAKDAHARKRELDRKFNKKYPHKNLLLEQEKQRLEWEKEKFEKRLAKQKRKEEKAQRELLDNEEEEVSDESSEPRRKHKRCKCTPYGVTELRQNNKQRKGKGKGRTFVAPTQNILALQNTVFVQVPTFFVPVIAAAVVGQFGFHSHH